jgi:hypothetical protein
MLSFGVKKGRIPGVRLHMRSQGAFMLWIFSHLSSGGTKRNDCQIFYNHLSFKTALGAVIRDGTPRRTAHQYGLLLRPLKDVCFAAIPSSSLTGCMKVET